MVLEITGEEMDELRQVLTDTRRSLMVSAHRADSLDFKHYLQHREDVVDTLLHKLHRSEAVDELEMIGRGR